MDPTREELLRLFVYNGGKLFRRRIGYLEEAGGYQAHGRIQVRVNGVKFYRNRLVWIMHYGAIPNGMEVDHRNRIKDCDEIDNLRLATSVQNIANQPYTPPRLTVSGKWYFRVNRKRFYFDTLFEAACADRSMKLSKYGEFSI